MTIAVPDTDDPAPAERHRETLEGHRRHGEPLWALAGFAAFALIVLARHAALLEPDDYAYRASIVALAHGHVLLTNTQYHALAHQLGGAGILQWHHLASGTWISEKNPGYPFLAVPFDLAGLLRAAPLAYGALGCLGLYHGARAWLGRGAGALSVWRYCFSGAALTFAWRATMPSFTDASLVAAGAGGLLWTLLRPEASGRRRLVVGLASFVALEAAVLVRYTNAVELAVAGLAVLALARRCRLPRGTVAAWLSSVVVAAGVVLAFDAWAYGRATSTGYRTGEISFSLASVGANLRAMPAQFTRAMPLWLIATSALGWIALRPVTHRASSERDARARDAVVAGVLGAGWLGLWFLYLTYTWTATQLGGAAGGPGAGALTVHVIRFYLPALGPMALLGAWVLRRIPRRGHVVVVGVLVVGALWSFQSMATSGALGAGPGHGAQPGAPGYRPGPGVPLGPPGSPPVRAPSGSGPG